MAKKKEEPKYIKKLPSPFNKMDANEFEGLTNKNSEASLNQKASYAMFTAKKYVPLFSKLVMLCFIFAGICLGYIFYIFISRPNPLLIASYPDGRLTCVTEHSDKNQGIRQHLNRQQMESCQAIESLKIIEATLSEEKEANSNAK